MKSTGLLIKMHVLLLVVSAAFAQSSQAMGERYALIIGGAGGQKEFSDKYFEQTRRLYDLLADSLGYKEQNLIYLFEDLAYDSLKITAVANSANVRNSMEQLSKKMHPEDQLLVVLIGHGTFDGEWAKFNLVGPDLKDIDYAEMLATLPTRRIIVVNTSSASGPFIKRLSTKERVVVTATKSGAQYFETNFADFFLDALANEAADSNKDKRISLLEAFTYARTSQDDWFEENRRLRAEHPLLDDNGDGVGSQEFDDSKDGLWASRVYLGPAAPELEAALQKMSTGDQSPLDKLRLEKFQLQQQIEELKTRKDQLAPEEYSKQLETLLIRFAQVSRKIKQSGAR
ncbi:MAG: hypothetical protein ACE5IY_01780 [bacterium]